MNLSLTIFKIENPLSTAALEIGRLKKARESLEICPKRLSSPVLTASFTLTQKSSELLSGISRH